MARTLALRQFDACRPLAHIDEISIRPNIGFQGKLEMTDEGRTDATDPGCVKTLCRCYDSPVILGGIDEALR
jgi:hypothetical protein